MAKVTLKESFKGGGVYGCLVQYPDANGEAEEMTDLMSTMAEHEVRSVFASDLMALLLMKSPGLMGADVVVGSTQRFGV